MLETGAAINHEAKLSKQRFRASLDNEHNIKSVDLFVDYTGRQSDLDIVTARGGIFSEYLRDMLAPIVCPSCNSQQVKRSQKRSLSGRILRIAGRKVFFCSGCGWKKVIKVYKWEWEIVTSVIFAFVVILFASIQWIRH